jgi:hypothetical protein
VQGSLAALDLSEGSPLLPCLVPVELEPLRTTYEGDFGRPIGDVYYFPRDLLAPDATAFIATSGTEFESRACFKHERVDWKGTRDGVVEDLPGIVLFFPRAQPAE